MNVRIQGKTFRYLRLFLHQDEVFRQSEEFNNITDTHTHTRTDGHTEWLLELPVEAKNLTFVSGILMQLRPTVVPTPSALTMLAPSNVNVTQETLSLGWLTQVSQALRKYILRNLFDSQDVLISMNARLLLRVALTPSAPTLSAPSLVTVSWVMSSGLLTGAALT